MSNKNLSEKLLQLWAKKKLAHFYIIQPSPSETNPREFTQEWTQGFLASVLHKEKGLQQVAALELLNHGHPDILFVRKEEAHKNYSVKDDNFSEFFRFQNFSSLDLEHRFIVIDDAQSITTIIANKLLKTLEEPAKNTTIFLLDPYRHEILPTISSRAIFLRIPSNKSIQKPKSTKSLTEYFNSFDLGEDFMATILSFENNPSNITPIFEYLKNNKGFEVDFIKHLVNFVSLADLSYDSKQSFLNALQWYEKAATFNNYSPEKLTGLLHSIAVQD
jgi:DNA polymerase-3 subunit delta'